MNLAICNRPCFSGLEITHIDLAQPVSAVDRKHLINMLNEHHLLIIKKQNLTEQNLVNASYIFGEPVQALVPTFRLNDYPLITQHSNKKGENNQRFGVTAPEYVFHADSYFTANPNKATLFYSIKSPEHGGETYFVNMIDAYDALTDEVKSSISNKKAIYKNAFHNQPPVSHPVVRIHPPTGKKALFVNIHRALGIECMESDKALDLLSQLYEHAIEDKYIYKHKWDDGDLLVWSNITTMHCSTHIDNTQERSLYRILIKGDLPVV